MTQATFPRRLECQVQVPTLQVHSGAIKPLRFNHFLLYSLLTTTLGHTNPATTTAAYKHAQIALRQPLDQNIDRPDRPREYIDKERV